MRLTLQRTLHKTFTTLRMRQVSETFRAIEPIRSESDKEFSGGENPRRDLSQLFREKDKLAEQISLKVQEVLQSEYAGASDEVKSVILRLHEKILINLM